MERGGVGIGGRATDNNGSKLRQSSAVGTPRFNFFHRKTNGDREGDAYNPGKEGKGFEGKPERNQNPGKKRERRGGHERVSSLHGKKFSRRTESMRKSNSERLRRREDPKGGGKGQQTQKQGERGFEQCGGLPTGRRGGGLKSTKAQVTP